MRYLVAGLAAVSALLTLVTADPPAPAANAIASPDGRVRAEVTIQSGVPHYRVLMGGKTVISDSALGLDLADGTALGPDSVIEKTESRSADTRYRQHPGKRSEVTDKHNETTFHLATKGPAVRRWQLIVRAADDGVAFRYHVPAQAGLDALAIAGERTTVTLPADAVVQAIPLNSFTTPHEGRWQAKKVADLPPKWLLGLPLLAELPGTGWAAVTEANLTDYAGLYLARPAAGPARLVGRLSPLPKEPKVAVRAKLPHSSPWRMILVGEQVGRLVESDMILNLNEPSKVADPSWIKPGKTTFPWWNGFHEENVPFKSGLNTATAKHYIDFCAEAGIPYHSLDGIDDTAWYGGPLRPYKGADIVQGVAGLDLQEVLKYAAAKGVRIRCWMHWEAAYKNMKHAFPLYRKWGIEGVMLDFMDRDDQEMVRMVREVLETAAANQLTVTLHGASKPTGLERTFPNLLNSEAVLNLEFDKWDKLGVPPRHEVTVPFTRMLAGPLDFHQGSFRTVTPAAFIPRDIAPQVMGTAARTLASYVVYQNHLPMVADYPTAYRGHPGLPALAKVPCTWDDTRFVDGRVGESVAIARRSGADWWVGGLAGETGRELKVGLGFLPAGRFTATVYRDAPAAKHGMAIDTTEVGAGDTLSATMIPDGGVLMHLTPASRPR